MINMRRIAIAIIFLGLSLIAKAQDNPLLSGPWVGNVELRNVTISFEVSKNIKAATIKYKAAKGGAFRTLTVPATGREFQPIKVELNGLDINTIYNYQLLLDGKPVDLGYQTTFKTKDLWQHRKPAPDFNFLAGSCAYFNEVQYDRPGKPYGLDSSIFKVMGETTADFNLWLGDSWYTREVDYYTVWGLNYRVARDRRQPVLQKFLAAMPHYFIWDDHDFGPNNAGKGFILKDSSREVFKKYTSNPSYGENGQGIYTKFSFSDVDFFLTDNRYFRSEVRLADSINGKPNPDKTYFGRQQMEWLKNALLYSNATFKIIATGGQILNPVSTAECMRAYSYEYNELMEFLAIHRIRGVLFLTGDRHHSEVIKVERPGLYPLFDITVSPLTATVGTLRGAEINNPFRLSGTLVEAQNFGNISVSGNKGERLMRVNFNSISGDKLAEWSVSENQLK